MGYPRAHAILTTIFMLLQLGSSAPYAATAQGLGFYGTVTDMATGNPISGATVRIGDQATYADAQGHYALSLPPGIHDVRAEAAGYIGMTHTLQRSLATQATELHFEMIPRFPSEEQAATIDAKMRRPPSVLHVFTDESMETLQTGLSGVTTVPSTVRVKMLDGTIVTMAMDEYLKGVVPYEMSPSWPMEALKAQAVAARSYAATNTKHHDEGYDVCTSSSCCQFWGPTHYDTTDAAVDATHGVAAFYDGSIIYAFYHSSCGGETKSYCDGVGASDPICTIDVPYLQPVTCTCGQPKNGHGTGMCQWGARAMAIDGKSYVEILQHYYTGITVEGPTPNAITAAAVSPAEGTELTEFAFTATYDGPSPILPAVANVIIDDRAYAMERVPNASGSGYHYRLVVQLPVGSHTHHFHFDDGYGHVSRIPASGTYVSPDVVASAPGEPTPTPVPPLSTMARSHSATVSTVADWGAGTFIGTSTSDVVGEGALVLASGSDSGSYTSAPLALPELCQAVALSWVAQDPPYQPIALELRTRSSSTDPWSAWQAIAPSDSNGMRAKLRMSDLRFGTIREAQFRATLTRSDDDEPVLEQVRLTGLAIEDGGIPASPTSLGIVSRDGWGADQGLRSVEPEYRTPRIFVLHHTGAPAAGLATELCMRGLYYYDAVIRELGDLGVHYLIDEDGVIYEGRYGGLGAVGQHAEQYDYHSTAIALLGNLDTETPSAAMLESLTDLLAELGGSLGIPATEQGSFQNITAHTIAGLNELFAYQAPSSPGANVIALLPDIRNDALAKMGKLPSDGASVGGIVSMEIEATSGITQVTFAIDDTIRYADSEAPYAWHWQTYTETETPKMLQVTTLASGSETTITRTVEVDHTPPTSASVIAPLWTNQRSLELETGDATHVQFSRGWMCEGEELYHTPGSGAIVTDAMALNGEAWEAISSTHTAGDWFGPYACDIPSWTGYQALFRLRRVSPFGEEPLATLKVQDVQGQRIYAQRTLWPGMLPADGSYGEVTLDLPYQAAAPTCCDPDLSDGLEFFTHYAGAGGLALDRVTLWTAPQPITETIYGVLPDADAVHTLDVRFTDEAGNAATEQVTVGLDRIKPIWHSIGERSSVVQDPLSGIDTLSVTWSESFDNGESWGAWQPLSLTEPLGFTQSITLTAPIDAGPLVRFAAYDVAGNRTIDKDQSIVLMPLVARNTISP